MAVYGDITNDSRVQREADALARAGHEVTLFCFHAGTADLEAMDPRVRVVAVAPGARAVVPGSGNPFRGAGSGTRLVRAAGRLRWLIGYVRALRAWGRRVGRHAGPFDVWHLHDLHALVAVARFVPREARLVYDAHDLFLETGFGIRLPPPGRAMVGLYEGWLYRRVDLLVTVNRGVADTLQDRYGRRRVAVVHNCPPRWIPPSPRPDLIRQARRSIPASAPIVLYHGVLSPTRGLRRLCDAMLRPGLGDAHLALLGFGEMREELIATAADPRFAGRIHVLDPVLPSELLPWVASADVGVMPFPPETQNLVLSTPNKLFECLAAGTPVVTSAFAGMRRIVLDDPLGPLGTVCDPTDTESLAGAIASICSLPHADREDLRRRCLAAAHARWNWETEAATLEAAYAAFAARPAGR